MSGSLESRIRACMAGDAGTPQADAAFDDLARAVFAVQFAECEPYRAYCEARGITPAGVRHWSEIPAAPVRAFQDLELRSGEDPVVRVFETSGTTTAKRGRHALSGAALGLYGASLLPSFRRHVLPEMEGEPPGSRSGLLPIALTPPSQAAPHSSLFYMFDRVLEAFFLEPPRRVFGPGGLDAAAWRAALAEAERHGRPACLLGTALALHAACEDLERADRRYYLPPGSRVVQTGGTKGSGLSLTPRALRSELLECLGVEPDFVVAEYGMTEAGSQFYESELRDAWERGETCAFGDGGGEPADAAPRSLHGPPWARAVVCDLDTLEPARPGETGVLRLVDLANLHTLSFLQTEDLAVAEEGSAGIGSGPFVLLGRATGADARGCSLTAEEWLRHARQART